MRFYVYCLSDESDAAPSEGLSGVGGARVRLLPFGGLSVVVSEFEGERAAVTRENLLAHNRVNAHVLARVTPLPSASARSRTRRGSRHMSRRTSRHSPKA